MWEELETGKEVCHEEGYTGPVNNAVLSPDGRQALSGSEDATVRLWDFPGEAATWPDSAGYRASKDSKNLGADVDLVGPGKAYER